VVITEQNEFWNDQRVNDNLNDSLPPTIEEIDNEATNFGRESKRPRGTTSKVWDHFTKNGIKEGITRQPVVGRVEF